MGNNTLRFLDATELAPPEKQLIGLRAGDFILIHLTDWPSVLVSIGQYFRFRRQDHVFAYWNHAAVVINEYGDTADCHFGKIRLGNVNRYDLRWYTAVKTKISDESRLRASAYALDLISTKYTPLQLLVVRIKNILASLAGFNYNFGLHSWEMPGGFVAKVLDKTDAYFDRDCNTISPADLARYFNVDRPGKEL